MEKSVLHYRGEIDVIESAHTNEVVIIAQMARSDENRLKYDLREKRDSIPLFYYYYVLFTQTRCDDQLLIS